MEELIKIFNDILLLARPTESEIICANILYSKTWLTIQVIREYPKTIKINQ